MPSTEVDGCEERGGASSVTDGSCDRGGARRGLDACLGRDEGGGIPGLEDNCERTGGGGMPGLDGCFERVIESSGLRRAPSASSSLLDCSSARVGGGIDGPLEDGCFGLGTLDGLPSATEGNLPRGSGRAGFGFDFRGGA